MEEWKANNHPTCRSVKYIIFSMYRLAIHHFEEQTICPRSATTKWRWLCFTTIQNNIYLKQNIIYNDINKMIKAIIINTIPNNIKNTPFL